MARTLDFNTVIRPTLQLVMMDDARTEITVTTPTEKLVEDLQVIAPELEGVLANRNPESTRAAYELAAKLISCNRNGVTVSADELRSKYRLNLEALLMFFGAYVEFIDEITNAKNSQSRTTL